MTSDILNEQINMNTTQTNLYNIFENVINSTTTNIPYNKPKIISKQRFDSFNRGFSSKICSICLELNNDSVMLPCYHCFHEECIGKWLMKKSVNCPMCKFDCKEDSSTNQIKE